MTFLISQTRQCREWKTNMMQKYWKTAPHRTIIKIGKISNFYFSHHSQWMIEYVYLTIKLIAQIIGPLWEQMQFSFMYSSAQFVQSVYDRVLSTSIMFQQYQGQFLRTQVLYIFQVCCSMPYASRQILCNLGLISWPWSVGANICKDREGGRDS